MGQSASRIPSVLAQDRRLRPGAVMSTTVACAPGTKTRTSHDNLQCAVPPLDSWRRDGQRIRQANSSNMKVPGEPVGCCAFTCTRLAAGLPRSQEWGESSHPEAVRATSAVCLGRHHPSHLRLSLVSPGNRVARRARVGRRARDQSAGYSLDPTVLILPLLEAV